VADVVISYAREDLKVAVGIAAGLEADGLDVWWDRELIAGEDFDEAIERELRLAGCVLVLWSNTSVHSDWVRSEASLAVEREVLVPVFVEKVGLPLEFRLKHTLDLATWGGDPEAEEFVALRRDVAARLGRGGELTGDDLEADEPARPRTNFPIVKFAIAVGIVVVGLPTLVLAPIPRAGALMLALILMLALVLAFRGRTS
jgi:hypothetical protein